MSGARHLINESVALLLESRGNFGYRPWHWQWWDTQYRRLILIYGVYQMALFGCPGCAPYGEPHGPKCRSHPDYDGAPKE